MLCLSPSVGKSYIKGLNLEGIDVEIDLRRRTMIDDQFNTSVPNTKCIGDVTFRTDARPQDGRARHLGGG